VFRRSPLFAQLSTWPLQDQQQSNWGEACACVQGPGEDHAERAGEYLAAAVLQHAAPSATAETAARSVITAVQSGTAEPKVFTVGNLAVNCDGEIVGLLANNGLEVVGFDGITICAVEKVTHEDGQVIRHSGAALFEEFVDNAAQGIVTAAVVRTCVVNDTVIGYMSSHKRVVDDSGTLTGTFDGSSIVHGQSRILEVQPGGVVALRDIPDAAFRGAAQAGAILFVTSYLWNTCRLLRGVPVYTAVWLPCMACHFAVANN
jgi:hypothetical protein